MGVKIVALGVSVFAFVFVLAPETYSVTTYLRKHNAVII